MLIKNQYLLNIDSFSCTAEGFFSMTPVVEHWTVAAEWDSTGLYESVTNITETHSARPCNVVNFFFFYPNLFYNFNNFLILCFFEFVCFPNYVQVSTGNLRIVYIDI